MKKILYFAFALMLCFVVISNAWAGASVKNDNTNGQYVDIGAYNNIKNSGGN